MSNRELVEIFKDLCHSLTKSMGEMQDTIKHALLRVEDIEDRDRSHHDDHYIEDNPY
jgi:hypothetical protein